MGLGVAAALAVAADGLALGVAVISEAVGVAVEVDGLTVEVADGVGVDDATLGVGEGLGEVPGVAAAVTVATAVAIAELVGAAEASAVAVVVTAAVLDAAALPSVAEGTGDAMLEVADGVGVDDATLGACEGVGDAPGVAAAVAVATAVAIAELVGAAEAVVSGERVILGAGCRISGCSRFASGCDASACAPASITGNASIQIEIPINNARKAQARVGPTITMPPSIARAPEGFELRGNAKSRLLPFPSNTRWSKGRVLPIKYIARGG